MKCKNLLGKSVLPGNKHAFYFYFQLFLKVTLLVFSPADGFSSVSRNLVVSFKIVSIEVKKKNVKKYIKTF